MKRPSGLRVHYADAFSAYLIGSGEYTFAYRASLPAPKELSYSQTRVETAVPAAFKERAGKRKKEPAGKRKNQESRLMPSSSAIRTRSGSLFAFNLAISL
jgi:hypothetical protein